MQLNGQCRKGVDARDDRSRKCAQPSPGNLEGGRMVHISHTAVNLADRCEPRVGGFDACRKGIGESLELN